MIRPVRVQDAKKLADIIKEGMEATFFETTIYSSKNIEAHFQILISQKSHITGYYYFGFYLNDELTGFAEWRLTDDEVFFLNNIYIKKKHRGLGIGQKLLTHGIQIAKEKNAKSLELDVFKSNISAYEWYQKNDFKEVYEKEIYQIIFEDEEETITIQVSNIVQSLALYQVLGYSQVQIISDEKIVFNIPNENYIRINTLEELNNLQMLNSVRGVYPNRKGLIYTNKIIEDNKHYKQKKLGAVIRMEKIL